MQDIKFQMSRFTMSIAEKSEFKHSQEYIELVTNLLIKMRVASFPNASHLDAILRRGERRVDS